MRLKGASGAWVELRIAGYELPDADPREDEWDANWLVIEALVRTAEGTWWSSREPSLTTGEVAGLVSWLQGAAQGVVPVATAVHGGSGSGAADDEDQPYWWDRLQEAGWLTFTEPNLSFAVAGYEGQAVELVVGLGAESARPPVDPERPGWCPVEVTVDVGQVRAAAAALEEELGRHPTR